MVILNISFTIPLANQFKKKRHSVLFVLWPVFASERVCTETIKVSHNIKTCWQLAAKVDISETGAVR